MDLYFKVIKETETGKKFTDVFERGSQATKAAYSLVKKYGFTSFRPGRETFEGAISSFVKPTVMIDPKVWKKISYGKDEYFPKRSSKQGKEILKEIAQLPSVDIDELNNIVGYDSGGWKRSHIGYNGSCNRDYYGFIVDSDWDVQIPDDCEEINGSEYMTLFYCKK